VIGSVLVMQPKAGCEDDVVGLFEREGVFARAKTIDGCLDVTMFKREEEILVVGTWTSAAAYDAWINHPERHSVGDDLNELLDVPITPESVATLYDIVLTSDEGAGS